MGQNTAARTAKISGGGVGFLELDDAGRLRTTSEAPVSNSVSAFSTNKSNADAVASLPAVAGETNHLGGFTITGAGGTAAGFVLATVTGLKGGTLELVVPVPAGVDNGITPIILNFAQPLPASAPNVAIVLTLPALGAGNIAAAVGLWGVVA